MNKAMQRIILVGIFLGVGALTAQASPYLIGKLGIYAPDESALETGYGMRGAFGLPFGDLGFGKPQPDSWLARMNVEAGVGYYTADVDEAGQSGELTVLPLTLCGVFTHQLPTVPIELRAGAGLGTYFAEFDTSFRDKTTVKHGLYLTAGAIVNLNEKFGILVDVDSDLASGDVGGWMLNGGLRYRF